MNKARDFVLRDLKNLQRAAKQPIVGADADTRAYGDGTDMMIAFILGHRGELGEEDAKANGKFWCELTARHPRATFVPSLAGYDLDPREVWEFDDVRRYMRVWASAAKITSPETIRVKTHRDQLLALLALCGVPGFENVTVVGEGAKPTTAQ
jgi:hypothetical protein